MLDRPLLKLQRDMLLLLRSLCLRFAPYEAVHPRNCFCRMQKEH